MQLEKFKMRLYEFEGWHFVDNSPCDAFLREIEVVRAIDADTLAERLRKAEATVKFYASELSWDRGMDPEKINEIRDSDLSVPEGLSEPIGGKRAREYFKRWRNE